MRGFLDCSASWGGQPIIASEGSVSPRPGHLFAYGTLGPSHTRGRGFNWTADAVRGLLYDLGPYPGLVALDDERAEWIPGHVREVELDEITQVLDPYEGVAEQLFQREMTRTQSGLLVWVYVYARPLPAQAVGPIARWEARR